MPDVRPADGTAAEILRGLCSGKAEGVDAPGYESLKTPM